MRRVFLLAGVVLLAAAPVRAQVDATSLASWGGTYLVDCANPKSSAVVVAENSIVVYLEGGRQVAATNASGSPSSHGRSAPENHVMTFVGDVAGDPLIVDIFHADGETWARVDGGAAVRKALGKAALDRRYLRCEVPRAAPVELPNAPPGPVLPSAAEYAMDPAFAALYRKALGKYGGERWLVSLQGPGPETRKATIAGAEYVVLAACKDHDCADNNTTLLFSPEKRKIYGKVRVLGKSALIGKPPKEVQKDLGELWWKQWGQASP